MITDRQASDKKRLAAVVGWPVSHSLSPLIHQTWAKREERDADYLAIAAPPDYPSFSHALDTLRDLGFQGVNVTLPHKENALQYCKTATEAAIKAGAANMVTFGDEGPAADNSDITGFAAALSAASPVTDPNLSALILGAGGAAKGVYEALRSLGLKNLSITNRTREKAMKIAERDIAAVIDWSDRRAAVSDADIVVNTTSLGMTNNPPLDLDDASFKAHAVICDIVYQPLLTPLLRNAASRGHRIVDGLSMLMHQAVPGYRTWLGDVAVVDNALRRTLEDALEKRANF
ncbi:MAG: shikimate dehydrogenase [Pseudomonadota bacterium]